MEQDLKAKFESLFREHNRMITSYLHGMIGDWGEAADLTQETFVVAYRKFSGFDPARPMSLWLRGIARNLARNAIRRKYRHREFMVEGDELDRMYEMLDPVAGQGDRQGDRQGDAPGSADWEEQVKAIDHCLEQLPEKQRQAVDLHYRQDRSAREVAQAIGMLERSVFQMLWQVRNALRDCVTRWFRQGEVFKGE